MIRAQIKNPCTPQSWTKGKSGGACSFWTAVTAPDLNGSWDLQGQGKEEARRTPSGVMERQARGPCRFYIRTERSERAAWQLWKKQRGGMLGMT